VVVKTVWLYQIHNVEAVNSAFSCIAYLKVEPLSQRYCTSVVILKFQIIFKLTNLNGLLQISTFESRLKN